MGLANVINVYDPSLVTLGGSVVLKNVELVLKPIRDCVEDYVINRLPRMEVTSLGDDIVLYGAVGAVIENIMAKPED
ncbi:MAG: hypothetical protein DRJ51_03380 [Thermoprotei archaeon]|nr:MAG: hypothetical protein DRJ51_03380 [Thermoprotei archaeon]